MRWNRRRSAPSSPRAWRARTESSSWWASSTSKEAAIVVSGDRSSWLTSEVKRASRSIRSWSWSTIRLKELANAARSGSPVPAGSRVSSWPPAMATAARETPVSGRSDRALAERPRTTPRTVVTTPAATMASARMCRVCSSWLDVEEREVVGVSSTVSGIADDDLGSPRSMTTFSRAGGPRAHEVACRRARDVARPQRRTVRVRACRRWNRTAERARGPARPGGPPRSRRRGAERPTLTASRLEDACWTARVLAVARPRSAACVRYEMPPTLTDRTSAPMPKRKVTRARTPR